MDSGDKAEVIERAGMPQFDAGFRARLHDLLKWRRDVRRFKREKLPEGALERLISIACLSPRSG